MYSLVPFWFMGGLALLLGAEAIVAFFWRAKRKLFLRSMAGTAIVYTILFWFLIGLTTNIERDYVFNATWKPIAGDTSSSQHMVLFEYQGYPGTSERVNSQPIHEHLLAKNESVVSLTIRVSYDFGTVRGYSLEKVDALPANEGWVGGTPPWEVFRQRTFASRWFRFVHDDSTPSR